MIKFRCSQCGQLYRVSDEDIGKRFRCKVCKKVDTISKPEDEILGNGDSVAAYNNLLRELARDEKAAPAAENES